MLERNNAVIIDYVSSTMDEQDFEEMFRNCSTMPGQQAQKYNRLMIQGLSENGAEVKVVSARPIPVQNCFSKYIPTKRTIHGTVKYLYLPILNIKPFKAFWQLISSFFLILFDKCDAVILDVLNASVSYGAVTAACLKKKPCIGIVTDLPELMVTGTGKSYSKLVWNTLNKCSGYVLLTKAMNYRVNPEGKPYVIIEALCDSRIKPVDTNEGHTNKVKKCMYAGLLDERYGVKNLVDGFIIASIEDVELHIYGDGPYAEELKKLVIEHQNVIYHGTVLINEVVEAELDADLLINPRPTHEEFTKYSFPSKNMEYMASATPVLTTDLPGMPEDYKEYVYLIKDENAQGIAKALKDVMSIDMESRIRKGQRARQFVLNHKNNVIQSRKVMEMIRNI